MTNEFRSPNSHVRHREAEWKRTVRNDPRRGGLCRLGGVLLLLVACVISGCSSSKTKTPDELASRREGELGLLFGKCVGQNKGKPPKTVEQVKEYCAKRITSEQLTAFGVASVDDLFISPRDGLPYKMVPYQKMPPVTGDPVVVFYEQKGQDGLRRAALLEGGTMDYDDATLAKMVPSFKP